MPCLPMVMTSNPLHTAPTKPVRTFKRRIALYEQQREAFGDIISFYQEGPEGETPSMEYASSAQAAPGT